MTTKNQPSVLLVADTLHRSDQIAESIVSDQEMTPVLTRIVTSQSDLLEALAADVPDVVIYEYPLSLMDGLLLPKFIRSWLPASSIIAVVDDVSVSVLEDLVDLDDWIPFSSGHSPKLRSAVRRGIRRSRFRLELESRTTTHPSHIAAQTSATPNSVFEGLSPEPTIVAESSPLTAEAFGCVFESPALPMAITTMQGRPINCNQAFEAMLGYTSEELKSMVLWDLSHPDDVQKIESKVAEVLSGNRYYFEADQRYMHRDGRCSWTNTLLFLLPGTASMPPCCLVTMHNIDDRKQVENALRMSEARYRVIFENAAFGMLILDKAGCIVEANPSLHSMLGYSYGELRGKRISDVTHSEDAPESDGLTAQMRFGALDYFQMEKRYLHKNGHPVWVRLNASLVRDGNASPLFCIGMVEDITRRRVAELEAQRRNNELTVLHSITTAFCKSWDISSMVSKLKSVLVDEMGICSGRVLSYDASNDSLSTELIWGSDECSQISMPPIGPDYEMVIGELKTAVGPVSYASGMHIVSENDIVESPRRFILPLLAENSLQGVLEIVTHETSSFAGARVAFLNTIAREVGLAIRRAHLHEQAFMNHRHLRELSRRLVKVQEDERRHLAHELHDEIGGLLTALSVNLHICGRTSGEAQGKYIEQAKGIVQELMGEMHELTLDLRPALLDEAGVVPALAYHFEKFTAQTNIEVDFIPPDWQIKLPTEVPTCVFRVVQEALTNVARHADAKTVHVNLSIKDGILIVTIRDNGKGFDSSRASHGTGIGLTGMRERVHALCGEFSISASPGNGAELQIKLPLGKKWSRVDHDTHCNR